jgi:hypothetical protein
LSAQLFRDCVLLSLGLESNTPSYAGQEIVANFSLLAAQIVLRIIHMKPKSLPKRRKTIVKSLSLPAQVIDLGVTRAKALSRSFSNHVSVLIQKDAASAK